MLLNLAIAAATIGTMLLLRWPRIVKSQQWTATATPLASIIGSGFLVLGPILEASYGWIAPLVMAGLCAAAYAFGGAIRFNIGVLDKPQGRRPRTEVALEDAASWVLAFAYVISVAYYLNLFGAFGVGLTPWNDPGHARWLTTAMLLFIAIVGWTGGFKLLEQLEYVAVMGKLAIIAGLLIGLAGYFAQRLGVGRLVVNPIEQSGAAGLTLAFGLLITVQGFETSRYLGRHYAAPVRIGSMRAAQWLSSAIYLVYIGMLAYVFDRGELKLTETAIIDMMRLAAPILPPMLVAAALTAQLSAAIADTSGSGGLIAELTRNRLKPKHGYALLVAIGLVLTWTANVFQIITYASRAFAAYYAFQSAIAALSAYRLFGAGWRAVWYTALALLGVAIVILAQPVAA